MDVRLPVFLAIAAVVAVGGSAFATSGPLATDVSGLLATEGSPSPTATATAGTPSPTATAESATPTPSPTPASNDTQRRYEFDGRRLARTHFARLRALGNFSATSNLTVIGPDSRRHTNVTYVIDGQDDTRYRLVDRGGSGDAAVVRTYERGDEAHVYAVPAGGRPSCEVYRAPYDDADRPVNATLAIDLGGLAVGVIDGSTWTHTASRTRDGVTLHRFDARGAENMSVSTLSGTVTDGRATLVVGTDGIVRYVDVDVTVRDDGAAIRYDYRGTFANVGDTQVATPRWYPC